MLRKSFSSLLIVSLSFLLISLLSGCGGEPQPLIMEGFLGGNAGLKVDIMEDMPPPMIIVGVTPFSVSFSIENVGEAPVGTGTDNPLILARLTGISYPNFGLTELTAVQRLNAPIEPAKMLFDGTIVPGEVNFLSFDNLVYSSAVADTITLPLRLEMCYDYESYATTKFCMKKDVLDSREDSSLCTLRGEKPVGNSGSPIHITMVDERPVSNMTIQLNLLVEHVGTGIPFQRSTYTNLFEPCAFLDMNTDLFKFEMFVEPVQSGIYDIKCPRLESHIAGGGASGVVKMLDGAPVVITCFVTRTAPMSTRIYEDLMNIKLRYRYGEFMEIPLLIQGHP
jgi:hypothetical protein